MNYSPEHPVVVQDTIHIATKMKTRLLNSKVDMKMGGFMITKLHLEQVIMNYGKSQHFLCATDLDGTLV